MISNPQERLRWNAYGGTPTVERLRWNAYGACFGGFAIRRRQLPISDLQSASRNGARTKKSPVNWQKYALKRQKYVK